MTRGLMRFEPSPEILPGVAGPECHACITIPARNEEATLARCLDALSQQVDLAGEPLASACFEVLLLLNNCTDTSAAVARAWQRRHPAFNLYIVEQTFPAEVAHVGTARRLLMDTAWQRLGAGAHEANLQAILTTDADTVVASDWLVKNMLALQQGADLVGGEVHVLADDLASLPSQLWQCHHRDRSYARLIAELEDLLDPQKGDPWPRHLDHFGSSLAVTARAYELAGGMPAVSPLEDEAFVDRARHAGLSVRHDPEVKVYTSARLQGRAEVGLAGQFQLWSKLPDLTAHVVRSPAYLEHRFRFLRRLRQIFETQDMGDLYLPTEWWKNTFEMALATEKTCSGFLGAVYCNILIDENFDGVLETPVESALPELTMRIAAARAEVSVVAASQ